jgi:hypothetical protein
MKDVTINTEMKTLVSTINHLVQKGYTDDYKVNEKGLKSLKSGRIYQPADVKVADFHRFEGTSDPADESILYAIETNDGTKGTLVDAFGPASDTLITSFMQKVEEISKNVNCVKP